MIVTAVRLDVELKNRLDTTSKNFGISNGVIMREALRRFLNDSDTNRLEISKTEPEKVTV